jgi:hypothetical protein
VQQDGNELREAGRSAPIYSGRHSLKKETLYSSCFIATATYCHMTSSNKKYNVTRIAIIQSLGKQCILKQWLPCISGKRVKSNDSAFIRIYIESGGYIYPKICSHRACISKHPLHSSKNISHFVCGAYKCCKASPNGRFHFVVSKSVMSPKTL